MLVGNCGWIRWNREIDDIKYWQHWQHELKMMDTSMLSLLIFWIMKSWKDFSPFWLARTKNTAFWLAGSLIQSVRQSFALEKFQNWYFDPFLWERGSYWTKNPVNKLYPMMKPCSPANHDELKTTEKQVLKWDNAFVCEIFVSSWTSEYATIKTTSR